MPVNTAARIKSFVQSAAYFRSFCPSFSHLTREMLRASNSIDFKPSEEMEEAKTKLLRTMEAHCKRRTVAPGDHLIVSTDASKYDCGATLEVVEEIEGVQNWSAPIVVYFNLTRSTMTFLPKKLQQWLEP